ncbi:MAG: UvrD-helicase domain-containing protein [Candidatus Eisenbacteria bacterium]
MDLFQDLNAPQKEAVGHTEGPLLVLAGAGSGKTRVLAHRIAHLLSGARARPDQILAVTFTNKAAGEMADRVRTLVGDVSAGMWMGTFHSVCSRLLRIEGRRLGISPDFTIYDDQDQKLLVKQVMTDLGMSASKLSPSGVLSRISWAKSGLLTPDEYATQALGPYEKKVAAVYPVYEAALRMSNALDFDDLITIPVRLLRSHPEVLERNSGRFRYILIDEYQDTNKAQYELVRLLSSTHRNICAVGDDDQSIYRWRGADVSNILNFERDFTDAKVIRLEQSYRSTKTILAASQAVIQRNKRRKAKTLWTDNPVGRKIVVSGVPGEQEEGRFVADAVEQFTREENRSHGDFVVLYRTNAQSRALEEALRKSAIPYVIVGGLKFYERREIKDIIAYLKLISNPKDSVSLARIINVPNRGIGDVTFSRFKEFAAGQGVTTGEVLDRVSEIESLKSGARRKLEVFRDIVNELRGLSESHPVAELIGLVAEKSGYLNHLKQQSTIEAMSRLENIQELVAGGYEFQERSETPTLAKFLEEVSLVMDIDMWDDHREAVSLMTLHNAKGLEFPIVFIAGVEEGLIPHHTSFEDEEELEEERRLFYVGLTRAKERVFLTVALGRRGFQGWMPQVGSRFLEDIPEGFIETLTPFHEERRPVRDHEDWGEEKIVHIGSKVRHPDWGVGTVVRSEGYGEQLRLMVKFGGNVTKRILARYANLEILEGDVP